MIEVEHVAKSFGSFRAVRDATFHVDAGEILGFLGVNGAGKTTTMRVLVGFYPPSSGTAKVAGLDVFEESLAVRRKIGYLPENIPLYSEMTVEGYLKFVAEMKGVNRAGRRTSIGQAIEQCRLKEVQGREIKKLSKGYRQRVGLAQALLGDPDVLVLDEPTIGLDPKQINEIRTLIRSFAGQKTVILSTHILPEVAMTCHRVAIINRGRVVAEDTPENLCQRLPGAGQVRLRIGGPRSEVQTKLAGLSGVKGVTALPDGGTFLVEAPEEVRPTLPEAVCAAGWDLHEMTPLTPTLEEVFIRLVTMDEEAAVDE